MVANEVSVKVKTKNTFKYDYFPSFLLCLKNAQFTTIKTPKKAETIKGGLN